MKMPSRNKGLTMDGCNCSCPVNTLTMTIELIAVNTFVHLTQYPSNKNHKQLQITKITANIFLE